jgi:phospholipid/cholesterol/gamma-HCH transport system substrate-binding protein
VIGTVLLTASLYFIGNRQNLFGKNIKLNAEFSNVNGLQLGNNVRYSGINVGTVSKIHMVGDTVILVEMIIKEKISSHIKKDAVATIGSDGLVGNMIINISPQKSKLRSITSGDTIPTYSRIGTDDMLTTLNVTNQNAALLTADLLTITTEIIEGKGTLGMLITDSVMAQDLKQTIFQLKKTSMGANKTITELNDYIATIRTTESVAHILLTDSVSGEKMKMIMDNLQESSNKIKYMTESLSDAVEDIKEGKGALNYLTTDETLVRNIDSTMVNIKESTRRFNENMEALKHNFFFRGYFRKLERQKKRDDEKADKN